MQVKVLFFGLARERAGRAEERIDLEDGEQLSDLHRQCETRFPRLKEIERSLVTAVNQEIASKSHRLHDGDEVAFLPPVSGGAEVEISNLKFQISNSFQCKLVQSPISAKELVNWASAPEDGAVVAFEGIVRNHSNGKRTLYLDYEAYEPMALRKLEELASEVKARFPVDRVAIVHRLGRMEIGETSVAIVVSSAHRKAAFQACHYAIDRLKQTVPIWKKEYFEDGAVWAEGQMMKADG